MDIEMIAATISFAALVIVWAFAPAKSDAHAPVAVAAKAVA